MGVTATDEPTIVLPDVDAGSEQPSLPFDVDAPIPFAPTARARRRLAPQTLPPLRLVATPGLPRPTPSQALRHGDAAPIVDASDPRRVRARALVRAGLGVDVVAAELAADEAAVVVWTADLPVRGRPASAPDGAGRATPRDAEAEPRLVGAPAVPAAASVDEAVERGRRDGRYAAGLALVAANARSTPHGVVVRVEDRELAARLLGWLLDVARVDPLRLRVIAVVEPEVAADRVRHELLGDAPLPKDRVHVTRSARDRPAVVLRISDAAVAERVRAWQAAVDQLLAGPLDEVG